MEKKPSEPINEKELRKLFKATKQEAGENLKYRIMQQITTESQVCTAKKKKEKKIRTRISHWATFMGVGYILLLLTMAGFFRKAGKEFIFLPEFYFTISLIGIILLAFGGIIYFDEKRKSTS